MPSCNMCGRDLADKVPPGFVVGKDPVTTNRTLFLRCPTCGKLCVFLGRDPAKDAEDEPSVSGGEVDLAAINRRPAQIEAAGWMRDALEGSGSHRPPIA